MYALKRHTAQIDEQLNRAAWAEENGTKVPGASYESGVKDAIQWLLAITTVPEPLGPEYDED